MTKKGASTLNETTDTVNHTTFSCRSQSQEIDPCYVQRFRACGPGPLLVGLS
jgi:hypothetical protein